MDFDELNILLVGKIDYNYIRSITVQTYKKYKDKFFEISVEYVIEQMVDFFVQILVTAYVTGYQTISFNDEDAVIEIAEMQNVLYADIAGKTFADRVREDILLDYMTGKNSSEVNSSSSANSADASNKLATIAETEFHRIFNTGAYVSAGKAVKAGKHVEKFWNTMDDDKVRATHEYLEDEGVPYDAEFYTFDGDSARFPGDFTNAKNNVGCRCWLTYRLVP